MTRRQNFLRHGVPVIGITAVLGLAGINVATDGGVTRSIKNSFSANSTECVPTGQTITVEFGKPIWTGVRELMGSERDIIPTVDCTARVYPNPQPNQEVDLYAPKSK